MATREKKLSVNRKQNTLSPTPSTTTTTTTTTEDPTTNNEMNTINNEAQLSVDENSTTTTTITEIATIVKNPAINKITPPVSKAGGVSSSGGQSSLARKLVSKNSKRIRKRAQSLSIKLKPKLKKNPQIKPKIIKTMLTNPKNVETKKRLLKNCTKQVRTKRTKPNKNIASDAATGGGGVDNDKDESLPPVLEPIFPIDGSIIDDHSKSPRKKAKRPPKIDNYSRKSNDDQSTNLTINQNKAKRVYRRKPKLNPVAAVAAAAVVAATTPTTTTTTNETIEDVMNDLNSLIKVGDKDESDILSESSKSDIMMKRSRKTTKRKRKDNIENTLSKLSLSQRKVIDMLDLNVNKIKRRLSTKRRHSIEKIPITNIEQQQHQQDTITTNQLTILNNNNNNSPRCSSPRTKSAIAATTTATTPKLRQTPSLRRSNPYKTRSDSPAPRILRNGKHRKLKDVELLDGLDLVIRRRRRNYSEFSGSESLSKFSGYDSDSSFSDLSSLHSGVVENIESKDVEQIKSECNEDPQQQQQQQTTIVIKRSMSSDHTVDTNSNCLNNTEMDVTIKNENTVDNNSTVAVESPSLKVPEKSIILDIMKQTFNDTLEEHTERNNPETIPTTTPLFSDVNCKQEEQADDNQTTITTANDGGENNEKIEETSETTLQIHETTETTTTTNQNSGGTIDQVIEDVINNCHVQSPTIHHHQDDEEEDDGGDEDGGEPTTKLDETPENLAIKENILQALGLQSLKAAKEAQLKTKSQIDGGGGGSLNKNDNYTGTLKTVIKLNRDKKKGRNSFKMTTLQKHNNKPKNHTDVVDNGIEINKDGTSSSWKPGSQSSDTAGAHRKSHYSNRSNMDGSSEHTSDGEVGGQDGSTKILVIPEKASSFSIHPGRLCKDECSYCFGKFGLFDTPCHIAQMKSVDRQNKILAAEKHLTRDSCLCDACYRHVDRKSNTPSYINKSYKRSTLVAPGPRQDHCHVLGCAKVASNILRRKWIIKMRKSICEVINLDLDNPGLHSIPICDEHYSMLEHLMVCAMCKRRLAKNHIHYLGPEVIVDLNSALHTEGIPLCLSDKPVVCKLCKYFAAIIMKPIEERPENSSTFFDEYKKRLLHFNDIVPMDEAAAEEPITVPTKEKALEKEQLRKKKKLSSSSSSKNQQLISDNSLENDNETKLYQNNHPPPPAVPSSSDSTNQSRPESPSDYMVDYNTLIPSIAMDCGSDNESRKDAPICTNTTTTTINSNNNNNNSNKNRKIPRPESVKQAVEISKNMKLKNDKNSEIVAVQRLGSNPSISVRQLFPCEEDLPLQGHIDFGNVKERTPEGWEKCTSIIQYDMETKHLWQELQKPYGNQSSFLRHLILLEKYFRNGDLVLTSNASHHSINYTESVHSRLRAYDNIPSNAGNVQPLSMLPFNRPQKTNSGIINNLNTIKETVQTPQQQQSSQVIPMINAANIPKNTPLTISQLNNSTLMQSLGVTATTTTTTTTIQQKSKSIGSPPGLISLQPGTNKPITSLIKLPQSQKIKFPITKNWRPNLIPIDPNKKPTERRAGLVQVISGGKPYHITLEDYKKMCAIKKSFELKQKRLQDASSNNNNNNAKHHNRTNNILKSIAPRKGLVISKSSTIITSPKSETVTNTTTSSVITTPTTVVTTITPTTTTIISTDSENFLEKLDRQIEKLEIRLNENRPAPPPPPPPQPQPSATTSLTLPKIPKSLTVIPQTVTRKPSRPSSPVLMITQKPKQQQQQQQPIINNS